MRLVSDNENWHILRLAYESKPDSFEIIGEPHTDDDGSNCRIHLRWIINPFTFKNIHIYGFVRHSGFRASRAVLFIHSDREVSLGNYIFKAPTPPDGTQAN
jgi:hypothetical protein